MIPPRCMLSSPRSAPFCHRFDQVQASPALCPCEPRRPLGETQAVPCGARSDTRLLPASGAQLPSAQIHSVRMYNTRLNIHFNVKTVLTFLGHVRLSRKKRSTGSLRRFRSFLAELGPARRETAGFTPCVPRRTHPRRKPGPKRPSTFPAWREPPIVCLMTPCLGGCAVTYASARGVWCAHAMHCTQQTKQLQGNDLFAETAADRPNSSSSSTQQRRWRGSGCGQLRASELLSSYVMFFSRNTQFFVPRGAACSL